jgi:hypothetical protein
LKNKVILDSLSVFNLDKVLSKFILEVRIQKKEKYAPSNLVTEINALMATIINIIKVILTSGKINLILLD